MSRRTVLWIAFVAVHVGVAIAGWTMINDPMGDVYRVYEPWSRAALDGQGIVGVTEDWVYPPLALVPMILTHVFTPFGPYTLGWAILVTLLDAVAFAVLVGRAVSVSRVRAAWFWLAFTALLGPVGMYRLDGITVPLAIIGCLWLYGRPWAGSMLLAVATWIKVWPAALLAAAVITLRRRGTVIGGAVAVSALTLLAVVAAGGAAHALGFIGEQDTRGIQVEAPIAAPYLWGALLGVPGSRVYYSHEILTFQVEGAGVDAVAAIMTPVLALGMSAILVLGAVQAWRGVRFVSLFAPLALALVVGFIVFNKVASPQYLTWLIAPIVGGIVLQRRAWIAPALFALGLAGLTQLVYPALYTGVTYPEPFPVIVLTVRNIGLVVMLVWMVVRISRLVPARRALVPVAS